MQSLIKFIITIFFIMFMAYGQTSNDNKNNNAQQQNEESFMHASKFVDE